ncbi:MAG: hypothetical protein AAFP08_15005 [Bacteroidota bacterium]
MFYLFLGAFPFLVGGFVYWQRREAEKQKLEAYGSRSRDIYVYSAYPGDETVWQRADEERQWLKRSKNTLVVTVHEIYFRDGGRSYDRNGRRVNAANETWEEFEEFVEQFKAKTNEAREKWLNRQGREWYLLNVKKQAGVPVTWDYEQ